MQGDAVHAEALLRENVRIASEQGAAIQLAYTQYSLGLVVLQRGEVNYAQQHFQQACTLFRAQQHPWCIAIMLLGTGLTTLLLDDQAAATQHYRESLTLLEAWRENMLAREAALLVAISGLLLACETATIAAATQAVRLWGAVAAIEPRTAGKRVTPPFMSLPLPDVALREVAIARACMLLGDDAFDAAWAAGQAFTLEQAVAEALAFTTSAAE
jgi:hypothetical protein